MADGLVLPVPEVLSALYLVPCPLSEQAAREETASAIEAHVPDPLGTVARKMLEAGAVSVTSVPASVLPPGLSALQRHLGVPEELTLGVAGATDFAAFSVSWPPGWPPVHEAVARACAAALAARTGVPLVDSFVPLVLDPVPAIAGLPGANYEIRLADWVLTPGSHGDLGLRVTTKGLGRFGLPELQSHNVPPQLGRPWARLMLGLASRLLTLWIEVLHDRDGAAFAEVPSEIEVSEADVAEAYGGNAEGSGRVLLRLVFDPATDDHADSFLTVQPTAGSPSSVDEFISDACAALFGLAEREVR